MADLVTTRNYNDGEVLVRADLDAFLDDIETFLNVTKINDDNIQNSGITGSTKLLNQSVTEAKLATGSISTLKLQDGAVTTAKLADAAVTTVKITDLNITTAKLADAAVTTAKIADAAVIAAKLGAKSVTDTIIASDAADDALRAVSTNAIKDSAVTTAKINDAAVTKAKQAVDYVASTLSGSATAGSNYFLATSYTSVGRAIAINICSGNINAPSIGSFAVYLVRHDGVSPTRLALIANLSNGSSAIGTFPFLNPAVMATSGPTTFSFFDTPAAGSYQYGLEIAVGSIFAPIVLSSASILVQEV